MSLRALLPGFLLVVCGVCRPQPAGDLSARVEAAFERLQGPDSASVDTVKQELLQLGPDATPLLLQQASRPEAEAIAQSVIASFGESALEPLSRSLRSPLYVVRRGAAASLARLGSPTALDALAGALREPSDGVRSAAADALVSVEGSAVDRLLEATGDPDFETRYWAANALGRIGDERSVAGLVGLLASDDWGDRGLAAEALGRVGGGAGVEPLREQLAVERVQWVRNRIEASLAALVPSGNAQQ